jgi:nucleoside-diphosphate-sugar epimerase
MTQFTVIGASGFIGSKLDTALTAAGHDVYAPTRDDPALFTRPLGRVFYCAGLTGDFITRPFDTVLAHVTLLAKLLQTSTYDRLVYLSSTRLYDSLGTAGGHETDTLALDPALPRNVYDLSKALGENLCLNQSGGRAVVARLSNVFAADPAASGFLSDLLMRAKTEREIELNVSPKGSRDYIHADDAISALLALQASDLTGIVNIARGEVVTNAELAELFAAAGWTLRLTGQGAAAEQPVCDVVRMVGLGLTARKIQGLLASILNRL